MSQDFSLFKQRLIEAGYDSDAIEQILEVAKNSIYPKKYGLVWEEKEEKIKEDLKLKIPYLEEIKAREIKLSESTAPQHLLIEGDNYEALKLLQTTHRGKVNVIYIDPPYNTGNKDFKYNDRYLDKDDAWKHSCWLSFMHKRLILAKELMSEDGVVFISIGNDEFAQLKLLCDEIFTENNVETIIWQKTDSQVDRNTNSKQIRRFKNIHEYIIVCYKDKQKACFNKMMKLPNWKKECKNPDKDIRGPWQSGIISFCEGHKNEDKTSIYYYTITTPSNKVYTRHWFVTSDEFKALDADNRIHYPKNGDGVPRLKVFQDEEKEYFMESILRGVGTSSTAKDELLDILGDRDLFETPKPTKLIKEIIRVASNKNSIVLDFFAGSGTTGHAVLELNKEDGGNRQFILCTNNENNICEEVTYERLKRVISGYTTPKGKEVQGIPGNLKYLKVETFDKSLNTSEDLSYLYMPHVLPLLQLKHNAHCLIAQSEYAFVYENESFRFGIATDLASGNDFDLLVNALKDYPGEKILYVFSTDTHRYPKHTQLVELEGIIQPIPRDILNLLKGE